MGAGGEVGCPVDEVELKAVVSSTGVAEIPSMDVWLKIPEEALRFVFLIAGTVV